MKYNVKWYLKRTREKNEITDLTLDGAQEIAQTKKAISKVVTIGQACEEKDVTPTEYHKDNIGKYFLYQIVK